LAVFVLCGSASAATAPLNTTHAGKVSGGVYVGAYQPIPWSSQSTTPGVKEFNQTYNIPSKDVKYAGLYADVYAAGTDNRAGKATVSFDGNGDGTYTTLGAEDLNIASTSDGTAYWLNDHVDKVYSDYLMSYDVTSLIKGKSVNAKIKTENIGGSAFDGRLKMLMLVVAYNDGTTKQVQYWINSGDDWTKTTSNTTFETSNVSNGFTNAHLQNIGLSSADASYNFNGASLVGANPVSPISYIINNNWDVTNNITVGQNSTFSYTNVGSSFKTIMAILTVTTPTPEANFTADKTTGVDPLEVQFTDKSNGPVTYWAWDFNNDGVIDSTDQNPKWKYEAPGDYSVNLTVTGPGGTGSITSTSYIHVSPQCDLTVTSVTVPVKSTVFTGNSNKLLITIKNNGKDASVATKLDVYASDVDSGPFTTVDVPVLAPGAQITLTVYDPTNRPVTENTTFKNSNTKYVTYTANVDPKNTVPESNSNNNAETNNQLASVACPVYYNGYKGKKEEYNGDDSTQRYYDLRGGIVYSNGDSSYGAKIVGDTVNWKSTDIKIPSTGNTVEAWLYIPYTWDSKNIFPDTAKFSFNGQNIPYVKWYSDASNFGTYGNAVYGLLTFNVTSYFNKNGNNNLTMLTGTSGVALYPTTLSVVYQDPKSTQKQIFINDGFDLLGTSNDYGTTIDDATALVHFNGSVRDIKNVKNATLTTFESAADNNEGNLIFNGITVESGFLHAPSGYSSVPNSFWFGNLNVTQYLGNLNNLASIQETGTCLGICQQFLVLEYTEPLPIANFTSTIKNVTNPLSVNFNDTSIGDIWTYQWNFGDGNTSTEQNPTHVYAKAGTYTVQLTVTNISGTSDFTNIIKVLNPDKTKPIINTNLEGGSYNSNKTLKLSLNEPGTIYYTLDGTQPTTSSKKYVAPITISSTKTIKFFGVDLSGNVSNICTKTYKIDKIPPTAKSNVKPGLYKTDLTVKLTMNKSGNIYYTTNGVNPTKQSNKYNNTLKLTKSTVLKFIAIDAAGNKSPIYIQKYTIDKTAPKVTQTNPTKNSIKMSLKGPITVKFSENIIRGVNCDKIYLKNLKTGQKVSITKKTANNALIIQQTTNRFSKTTYLLYIPKGAVKDQAGNVNTEYASKFQTR
jgi:PKD repeat protein